MGSGFVPFRQLGLLNLTTLKKKHVQKKLWNWWLMWTLIHAKTVPRIARNVSTGKWRLLSPQQPENREMLGGGECSERVAIPEQGRTSVHLQVTLHGICREVIGSGLRSCSATKWKGTVFGQRRCVAPFCNWVPQDSHKPRSRHRLR